MITSLISLYKRLWYTPIMYLAIYNVYLYLACAWHKKWSAHASLINTNCTHSHTWTVSQNVPTSCLGYSNLHPKTQPTRKTILMQRQITIWNCYQYFLFSPPTRGSQLVKSWQHSSNQYMQKSWAKKQDSILHIKSITRYQYRASSNLHG